MLVTVDQVYDAAMKLSEAEREELRRRLVEIPEVPGEELTGEEYRRVWGEELKRRIEAIDRGEIAEGDWRDVMAHIRSKLESKA